MVKVRLYVRLSTGVNSSVVMDLELVTNFLGAFSRNVSEMFGVEFAGNHNHYLFTMNLNYD